MSTSKTRTKSEPVTTVRYKKIAPKTVPFDVYERDVADAEEYGARQAERYAESMLPEKLEAAGAAAVVRHMKADMRRTVADVDHARATVKHAEGVLRMLARVIEVDHEGDPDDLLLDTVAVANAVAELLNGSARTLAYYSTTRKGEMEAEAAKLEREGEP